MSDTFDPYYKWLGIPPTEQPANHYRLLGLPVFESDPDVIENAADQRMAHVRTYQSGTRGKLSQQLLNELSAARVCLLHPERKSAYDAQLNAQRAAPLPLRPADLGADSPGQQLAYPAPPVGPGPSSYGSQATPPLAAGTPLPAATSPQRFVAPRRRPRGNRLVPVAIAGAVVACLLVVGLILVAAGVFRSSDEPATGQGIQTDQPLNPIVVGSNNDPHEPIADTTRRVVDPAPPFTPPAADDLAPFGVRLSDRQYIELPDAIQIDGDFTIELWNRFGNIQSPMPVLGASGSRPAAGGDGLPSPVGWLLTVFPAGEKVRLNLHFDGEVKSVNSIALVNAETLRNWHHLALCREGNRVRLLLNGNRVVTRELERRPLADDVPLRLCIGADPRQRVQLESLDAELRGFRVSSTCRYDDRFTPAKQFDTDSATIVQFDFGSPATYSIRDERRVHEAMLVGPQWVRSDGSLVPLTDSQPPLSAGKSWKSVGFALRKISTGWIQESAGSKVEFEEIASTDDFIELVGKNGAARLRIHDDRISQWNQDVAKWQPLAPGNWIPDRPAEAETTATSEIPGNKATTPPDDPQPPETPVVERKLEVPGDAEQRASRDEIHGIFATQFDRTKTDKEAKVDLARELLKVAGDGEVKAVNQFVLLEESRVLALEAGEVDLAFEIGDALAAGFEINALELFAKIIGEAGTRVRTTAERESLIRHALDYTNRFLHQGRFDLAVEAAQTAYSLSSRISIDKDLRIAARDKQQMINEIKLFWDAAEQAREKLRSDPEDATASLEVGKYVCLIRRNWDAGLPYLARSNDPSLREAAAADLASPTESPDQSAVGNQWWELANRYDGHAKRSLLLRARHWYQIAMPKASAIAKLRLNERLQETEEIAKDENAALGLDKRDLTPAGN